MHITTGKKNDGPVPAPTPRRRPRRFNDRPLFPLNVRVIRPGVGNVLMTTLVTVLMFGLTAGSIIYMARSNRATDTQRFTVLKEKLGSEIARRVTVYRYGLMGTRSVFVASEQVNRQEFRNIVESLELPSEFPAATAMGYIDRVPTDEIGPYLKAARKDDSPDFEVRMLADEVTHDDQFIIKYIEPASENLETIGLDIGQESRHRAAAENAMRTGDVAFTAPITLVQPTGNGPGFLILLPHYTPDMPLETVAQREAALRGWVYMSILAERMFAGARELVDGELGFKVFDSNELALDRVLYDQGGRLSEVRHEDVRSAFEHARFHAFVPVEIGGREWVVAMSTTPNFKSVSTTGIWVVGIGGCLLAALLAQLLHSQTSSLDKAQQIARDMTADLRRAALTDRLTGLPNRSSILEKVQEAIHRAERVKGYHYAVLFLDFDRFKIINDSLGHNAGDELLVKISQRLTEALRPHDAAGLGKDHSTAARLGGDEFIVLLDGLARPADAALVADRLLEVLADCYLLGTREVRSTASIGVVLGHPDYHEAGQIIRDADTAMYEAKAAGRGQYKIFDAAMRVRAKDRLEIENDLHLALHQRQFFLMYQPILSLETGQIESCEALVRWQHPQRGMIGPDQFIPIAEETGLIVPMGEWVLDEAVRQFARWRADQQLPAASCISVNLSRKQLVLPNLFSTVTQTLRKHGVPTRCLHLEVTESHIMQDRAAATANLQRLRRVGIRIDIDDFGTGYSSLSCLHEFPIDVLKIDRAFVGNLETDRDLITVLGTVTELARNLGVKVVAEGIETTEQLELLRSLHCEYAQGYLLSMPLIADEVPAFASRKYPVELRFAA